MSIKINLLLLFNLFVFAGYSQDTPATSKPNKDYYTVEPSFGGKTKGEIIISDHLEDSLTFTEEEARANHRITSFHLTILCDDVVLKYFENNAGNSLTIEMKQALVKYQAGCTFVFDGIQVEWISKEYQSKGRSYFIVSDPRLRFIMK